MLVAITGIVAAFLFFPILIVIAFSFNSTRSLSVFRSLDLHWYRTLIADTDALASIRASVKVAAATAVVAAVLGTALALGITRARTRARRGVEGVLFARLVTPEIATAFALVLLFNAAGAKLSLVTVTIGHITFAIGYVAIIVRSRLIGLDAEIDEAAQDLGASPWSTFYRVTLPLLGPAILGGTLLAFVLSLDDFVTSFFTSGLNTPPLPLLIYGMIRFGVTPEINAIGTVMMLASVGIGATGMWLVYLRR